MSKINKEELDSLLATVEQLCRSEAASPATCICLKTLSIGDSACLIWGGALTWQIHSKPKSKLSLTKTRYRLNRLCKDGALVKRLCAGGTTTWWPVGLAKKLLEGERKDNGEPEIRGQHIKSTHRHDAGAHGLCSFCGRYSDVSQILSHLVACECGEKHGWTGSFKAPTKDSAWSDPRERELKDA